MEVTKWVLDFEGNDINGEIYPLEMCLINLKRQKKRRYTWRIWYPECYNDMVDEDDEYFGEPPKIDKHGMGWQDGNISLSRAEEQMREVFADERLEHQVHVKDQEKTEWVENCLSTKKNEGSSTTDYNTQLI